MNHRHTSAARRSRDAGAPAWLPATVAYTLIIGGGAAAWALGFFA